jgi:rhodanese-related sulfurtransferase
MPRGFAGSDLLELRPVTELPIEITPTEVSALQKQGVALRLIDVREPAEHAICHIDGAELIPMQTVPQHLAGLERDDSRIVVFCHHGMRSLSVVHWLRKQGIENCQSMAGGIDLWSIQIAPAVPRY